MFLGYKDEKLDFYFEEIYNLVWCLERSLKVFFYNNISFF